MDPLKMNIDEDEIEYEPDKLNMELSGGQGEAMLEEELIDEETELVLDQEFKLPPPRDLPDDVRDTLIRASLVRIWDGAQGLVAGPMALNASGETSRTTPGDMWMFLIVRLITRTADPAVFDDGKMQTDEESDIYAHQERLRQVLCDYIIADFPAR